MNEQYQQHKYLRAYVVAAAVLTLAYLVVSFTGVWKSEGFGSGFGFAVIVIGAASGLLWAKPTTRGGSIMTAALATVCVFYTVGAYLMTVSLFGTIKDVAAATDAVSTYESYVAAEDLGEQDQAQTHLQHLVLLADEQPIAATFASIVYLQKQMPEDAAKILIRAHQLHAGTPAGCTIASSISRPRATSTLPRENLANHERYTAVLATEAPAAEETLETWPCSSAMGFGVAGLAAGIDKATPAMWGYAIAPGWVSPHPFSAIRDHE